LWARDGTRRNCGEGGGGGGVRGNQKEKKALERRRGNGPSVQDGELDTIASGPLMGDYDIADSGAIEWDQQLSWRDFGPEGDNKRNLLSAPKERESIRVKTRRRARCCKKIGEVYGIEKKRKSGAKERRGGRIKKSCRFGRGHGSEDREWGVGKWGPSLLGGEGTGYKFVLNKPLVLWKVTRKNAPRTRKEKMYVSRWGWKNEKGPMRWTSSWKGGREGSDNISSS